MALDLNVFVTNPVKGTTVALFGGAIAASVTEANATVINMTKYTGGSLDFLDNSGTGTFAVVMYTSETGTGVFHAMQREVDAGTFAAPAITTTASTSASYQIKDIKAKYIKFVPTLTGTCNATFTFTPSN
jgi:hypothetical protein